MLRLAIAGVLSAVQNKCVIWMGLLCSSFTRMNMGTSKRSYLVPLGNTAAKSVAASNCLAARTRECICVRSATQGLLLSCMFYLPC